MPPFDLILRNARVLANADAVAIRAGRIAAVGRYTAIAAGVGVGPDTAVIDCGGRTIIPGLVDAHLHLFAAAARAAQVDCRPAAAPSADAVIAALRGALASGGPGNSGWVRGYGYDDSPAGLGRHLTRHDLDAVSPTRPVRVDHRSGHAAALNTAALDAMGIGVAAGADAPNPPGGVVVRDAAGHPTGLLLEPAAWTWPAPPSAMGGAADYPAGMGELGRRLLSYGITAVTDAGAGNGIRKWRGLASAIAAGTLPLRVTMLAGWGQLPELRAAGRSYGDTAAGGMLTLGHAKIMLTASGGALHPHPERLTEMVRQAQQAGYPAAIHAVEQDAVVAAAMSLSAVPPPAGSRHRPALHHRIEHCAECPPDVAALVRQSGAMAVVNPAWLHYDGARYARTVAPELLPHLHPTGALYADGIPLAFGSDAPVVAPNPWASIAAAITRQSHNGIDLGGTPMPSVSAALDIHAGGRRITVGQPADLAVVSPNPLTIPPAELPSVRAAATIIAGRVVWRDGV